MNSGKATQMPYPRAVVILLNWNGWGDTIECLESLLRLDYPNFGVVVCDNASTDGSVEEIKAWAEGRTDAARMGSGNLRELTFPPIERPLSYVEIDWNDEQKESPPIEINASLVLINTGANLGFAGGYNVGLRYAMACRNIEYLWLLNNDTVVRPDALIKLVDKMQRSPNAGICGSTLLYYHKPDTIQARGGATFNRFLGTHKHISGYELSESSSDAKVVKARLDYVLGASMLVSRDFLEKVGLLCEDYFLYFEEIDWAVRGKTEKFTLAYAPESIVYHKEGATIGSSSISAKVDFLALHNRLLFTRKHIPWALPTVWLGLLIALFNRIRRGQWNRVGTILKILLGATNRKKLGVGD